MPGASVFTTAVSKTVDHQHATTIVVVNASAVDVVVTLPKANAYTTGMEIRVIQNGTSLSTGLSVAVGQATDTIHGVGQTAVAGKSFILTHATERNGDSISLYGDGAGNWFAGASGTWVRAA